MNTSNRVWLEGVSGQYRGSRIDLRQGDLMLGRSQSSDLQIMAPNVSRRHALIRYADGKYYLQDQGSALGTRVNGKLIQETVLRDGDTITISESSFRFRRQQDSSASREVVPQQQPNRQSQQPISGEIVERPPVGQAREQEEAIASGTARAIAMNKSFVGKAILTWFLYYIGFYIVGLIFNVMYINEAKRIETMIGTSPNGKGCLNALLIFHLVIPAIFLLLIIITGGAILSPF